MQTGSSEDWRVRVVAFPILISLIRPFVQREAVLSSNIEGTQATLGEFLAAEAGAIVDRSPEDLREVGNYVVALEHGISRLKKFPLCVRLTRELHQKLMTGVQGHQAASGRFRRIQNWIGKPGSSFAVWLATPLSETELQSELQLARVERAAAWPNCGLFKLLNPVGPVAPPSWKLV